MLPSESSKGGVRILKVAITELSVGITSVEVGIMTGDLCEVGIRHTPQRMRENKMEEYALCARDRVDFKTFSRVNGIRVINFRNGMGAKTVEQVKRSSRQIGNSFLVFGTESKGSAKTCVGLAQNPMFSCARRRRSSSLRRSPPVPARVCSRSPVKIWRQYRERRDARIVKPACPPPVGLRHR